MSYQRPLKYNKLNFSKMENLRHYFLKVKKFLCFRLIYIGTFYKKNPYPTKEQLIELSTKLEEKMDKIKYWFKYQRKRQVLKGLFKYEVFFLYLYQ